MIFYILLAVIIILFVLLHSVIFPHLFLRLRAEIKSGDRGVKDIKEEDGGRTIIYEPEYKYRGIIRHYALSQRNGVKVLVCEVDKNLRYIEYDVCMFNAKGEIFKVLNVKEILSGEGITKTVEIDKNTAYISLVINKADGKNLAQKKSPYKISSGQLAIYFLVCSIVDIMSVFIVKICIAELFGGIFHESFVFSVMGTLVTGIVCAALIILNIILTLIILKVTSTVKVRKGGKNA